MRSTGTRPAWDVGDYVEKKFRTADHRGNAWFRGRITGQSRQSHHSLPPGSDPENMVKVHWLNGDPPENVDVSSARILLASGCWGSASHLHLQFGLEKKRGKF